MESDVQHFGLFLFYFLLWDLSVFRQEIFENWRTIFFNEACILIDEVLNVLLLDLCLDVAKKCLFDVFAFTVNPCLFRMCIACLHGFHGCSCIWHDEPCWEIWSCKSCGHAYLASAKTKPKYTWYPPPRSVLTLLTFARNSVFSGFSDLLVGSPLMGLVVGYLEYYVE